ncbi:hypothetical protein [Vulcanococcus limneticus]|uniref:hypothetical protein n=1 Tax=Vulcanococcus limneticus TaxID=2170428 RepID=UPI00398C1CD3
MREASVRGGRLIRLALALLLALAIGLVAPAIASAGPVNWQELPATADGRQWWDAGSLRLTKSGNLSVLSRFQPASEPSSPEAAPPAETSGTDPAGASPAATDPAAQAPRPRPSDLYVMEIDCDQLLFRDTSINGLPQWGSQWQPVGGDGLIEETVAAVCEAGSSLLASR